MRRVKTKPSSPEIEVMPMRDIKRHCSEWLSQKYQLQFFFYLAKPVNEIANHIRSPTTIAFHQERNMCNVYEQMRRYYNSEESEVRLRNYTAYYSELRDYLKPSFPHHNGQSSIMLKRKRRIYKLDKRQKNTEEVEDENAEQNKSVLKRLHRKTLYLEEIEMEHSEAPIITGFEQNDDDFKRVDLRDNKHFQNAEVHDIYDPHFSSEDEAEAPRPRLRRDKERPFCRKIDVSISSKEFIEMDMARNDCSRIDVSPLSSAEHMVDDLSELINHQSHFLDLKKANESNPQTRKATDSISQTLQNQKKQWADGHTTDNQSDTKFANSSSKRTQHEQNRVSRYEKPMFATINWREKRTPVVKQKERGKADFGKGVNANELRGKEETYGCFSTKKFAEQSLRGRDLALGEKFKSQFMKTGLVNEMLSSTPFEGDSAKRNRLVVYKSSASAVKRAEDSASSRPGQCYLYSGERTKSIRNFEKTSVIRRDDPPLASRKALLDKLLQRREGQSLQLLPSAEKIVNADPELFENKAEHKTIVSPFPRQSSREMNFSRKSTVFENGKPLLKTTRSEKNFHLISNQRCKTPSKPCTQNFLLSSKNQPNNDEYNYFEEERVAKDSTWKFKTSRQSMSKKTSDGSQAQQRQFLFSEENGKMISDDYRRIRNILFNRKRVK